MAMPDEPQQVDYHFDIMYPWAYQASQWIREVQAQNGLDIHWKFFSLAEINRFYAAAGQALPIPADLAHIDAPFDIYYKARDWRTIQNPVP
jgi:2-hydroxychromene-2-carboxylate isomerase